MVLLPVWRRVFLCSVYPQSSAPNSDSVLFLDMGDASGDFLQRKKTERRKRKGSGYGYAAAE